MFDDDMKARAISAPWRREIQVLLNTKDSYVKEVVLEARGEIYEPQPTFALSFDAAQTLMDDLWNCGLRPTEGAGSAGSLKATERHLEDMRRLVFESLSKKGGTHV